MTPESIAQDAVRLAVSKAGGVVWRNNVGAGKLDNGSFLRWGLANDSRTMNSRVKSADLIGIRPVLVTAALIGCTLGVFLSREVKRPGWRFHPNDPREQAQQAWIDIINALGGDAAFTTGDFT